jgi:hypothetical protein
MKPVSMAKLSIRRNFSAPAFASTQANCGMRGIVALPLM